MAHYTTLGYEPDSTTDPAAYWHPREGRVLDAVVAHRDFRGDCLTPVRPTLWENLSDGDRAIYLAMADQLRVDHLWHLLAGAGSCPPFYPVAGPASVGLFGR